MTGLVPPPCRWIEPEPPPEDRVRGLRDALRLPLELCEILVRRGHPDAPAARGFLRPPFSSLHPPALLPDIAAAVERIEAAVAANEKILVHGDYDADGLCAAALLARGLEKLGARVEPFVPHRMRDGYDLGPAGLARAEAVGAGLILTADCGVSAGEAVDAARAAGRDVIVTDHHRPPPDLPDAVAVVNPGRETSRYPFGGLAGVGVAFKLLNVLYDRAGLPEEALNRQLDLVALGTVSDLAPLEDENRILVRAGLRALERTRKPGLRALLRQAGLRRGSELTAADVGYRLGPRLNSAGRIARARTALRLLLTGSRSEARDLAGRLEERNRERRAESRRVREEAEAELERRYEPERDRAVVLWGEGWHPGVVGIVASRIVDRVYRPAVVVGLRGDAGRGSARSVSGFPLHETLRECAPLLERHGGHAMAAGLEIRRSRLPDFTDRMREIAARRLEERNLRPELRLDLVVPLRRAGADLHRWLAYLAPFGNGNPRPLLKAEGVRFPEASPVGAGDAHLKARIADGGGARLDAIGFGLGGRCAELQGGRRWDVVFELTEDEFRGRRRLQARLRDFRPSPA